MEKLYTLKTNFFWHFADLLSCTSQRLGKLYEGIIGTEYKKESEMFDISESKNLLHIGSGAYPITAIMLAKITDAEIIAIDKDSVAINLAKKVISKNELYKKITIKRGNGTEYPVERFDTIIVSSCSVPKIEILEHIFKTAKPKSKIIVRELEKNVKSLTNFIDSYDNILLMGKMSNHAFPNFKWYSFYLLKDY